MNFIKIGLHTKKRIWKLYGGYGNQQCKKTDVNFKLNIFNI